MPVLRAATDFPAVVSLWIIPIHDAVAWLAGWLPYPGVGESLGAVDRIRIANVYRCTNVAGRIDATRRRD